MSADQKHIIEDQNVEKTPGKKLGDDGVSASSQKEVSVDTQEVILEQTGEDAESPSSYRSFTGHDFTVGSIEKYDLSQIYGFYEFIQVSDTVFERTAIAAQRQDFSQTLTPLRQSEAIGPSIPTEPSKPVEPIEPSIPVKPIEPIPPTVDAKDPEDKDDNENTNIFPFYSGDIHYLTDGDDVYLGELGVVIHGGKGDDRLSTPWPEEGLSAEQLAGTGFSYNKGDGYDTLSGWGDIYFGKDISLDDLSFDGRIIEVAADGMLDVSSLHFYNIYFADGTAIDIATIYEYFGLTEEIIKDLTEVITGDDDDIIALIEGWNFVKSGAGDDIIDILGGHNEVFAGDGDDIIEIHGIGNEVTGGKGDDVIRIGTVASQHAAASLDDVPMSGVDDHLKDLSTIHYNLGDGNDVLAGFFNIQLGKDIKRDDISFEKNGEQSFIHFNDGGSLEISGMHHYETIKFYDGAELDLSGSGLTWVGIVM